MLFASFEWKYGSVDAVLSSGLFFFVCYWLILYIDVYRWFQPQLRWRLKWGFAFQFFDNLQELKLYGKIYALLYLENQNFYE